MLRLKEEIEWEKLKKYDFEEDTRTWTYWDGVRKIIIYKKDRRVSLNGMNRNSIDILYELIHDGLIEKVPWCVFSRDYKTTMTNAELNKELNKIKEQMEELKKWRETLYLKEQPENHCKNF